MQIFAIVVSLTATVVALVMVARTTSFLVRTLRTGQPDRNRFDRPGRRLRTTLEESFGHTRMLRWTGVGLAHWAVFFGFILLFGSLVEAYGELFDPAFQLPLVGGWEAYRLSIEVITALTLVGIVALMLVRFANHPNRIPLKSRFTGSNFWQAYYVEWTIVGVATAVFVLRGVKVALGDFPYSRANVVSYFLGERLFGGLSHHALLNLLYAAAAFKILISMAWFAAIAANPGMGIAWHRFTAPVNIFFKRSGDHRNALGALPAMRADFDNPKDDDLYGAGAVEHLTWKQQLDLVTCTECGRCQSQCPAWNTGKPLSPKLLIMNLRDHMIAKAPYTLAGEDKSGVPAEAVAEAQRPLVGTAEQGGVVDPDVLWTCTTCGACVEQCPVDIEHVDTIMDIRRHQVLVESSFPSEAGVMLRNLEQQGNPWGLPAASRGDWMADLPFEVRVVDGKVPDDVEWLFWVGCAGALEDRAKRVTRAVAQLLHVAGVSFAVLGPQETCSGDPARRMGNEYLYTELGKANVATLNAKSVRKVVATCPHCFNTIKNEYPQLGGHYETVHHTELLSRLVEDGRLVPMNRVDSTVTYHDPCYLGRHNEVYTAPRDLLESIEGVRNKEMHRCKERGFCCGAGGARMWMEDRIGKQVNVERTEEALATDADVISTACPFCMVMISDGVTAKQQEGKAADGVQVLDVAQLLAKSLERPPPAYRAATAPAEISPDVTQEGVKPVEETPQETASADLPQLAPAAETGGTPSAGDGG